MRNNFAHRYEYWLQIWGEMDRWYKKGLVLSNCNINCIKLFEVTVFLCYLCFHNHKEGMEDEGGEGGRDVGSVFFNGTMP
jgi:hypothetical protein